MDLATGERRAARAGGRLFVEDAPPDDGASGVVDEISMLIELELGIRMGELNSAIVMGMRLDPSHQFRG
jgi:hypothetical protein